MALISAASLYPLQVIEADRFLADLKTDKTLKPKADWDGSIVSLLNYPEIVHMMSDDLDWTKMMGEAIVNQQDDVLAAIQQLREKAVAEGIIKSDDKVKVVEENDNIIIQPASKEVIYVPQYPPEMLYEEEYVYQPISYYPDPYPYYYNPGAVFFAGAITGAFWGAVIDWDDGFWGGDWDWNGDWGGDIDIDFDCNNCIIGNDFNGKLNIRDADWKNIDRSKINFDRTQLNKLDRSKVKDSIKRNDGNRVKNKAADRRGQPALDAALQGRKAGQGRARQHARRPEEAARPEARRRQDGKARPGQQDRPGRRQQGQAKPGQPDGKPGNVDRPVGKKKAGAKADNRPKNPFPMGDVKRGAQAKKQSNRGAQSMGGGGYKPPSYNGRRRRAQHEEASDAARRRRRRRTWRRWPWTALSNPSADRIDDHDHQATDHRSAFQHAQPSCPCPSAAMPALAEPPRSRTSSAPNRRSSIRRRRPLKPSRRRSPRMTSRRSQPSSASMPGS